MSLISLSPPLLVGGQDQGGTQPAANPFGQDPARREAGHLRFQSTCSSCHGANGEGGQGEGHGPNLIDNPEIRRLKDSGIFSIIHNGIPGTLMPRFALPDVNIWELVAFIRGLNAPAIVMNVPGNQQKGKAIFYGSGGCGTCHMIRGRGGYLGSDLTNIGSAARLEDLRRFIEAPPLGAPDGFRSAFLVTPEGRKLRAVVKHRSNWSLQVLDENGQLHLLSGPAMNQVTLLPNSWMQGYSGKLTAEQIQDLLAFLSRQSVIEDQLSAPASGAEIEK